MVTLTFSLLEPVLQLTLRESYRHDHALYQLAGLYYLYSSVFPVLEDASVIRDIVYVYPVH